MCEELAKICEEVDCIDFLGPLLQAVRRLREAVDRGSAYEGLQTAKSVYHRCRSKRQYEASYDLAQVTLRLSFLMIIEDTHAYMQMLSLAGDLTFGVDTTGANISS